MNSCVFKPLADRPKWWRCRRCKCERYSHREDRPPVQFCSVLDLALAPDLPAGADKSLLLRMEHGLGDAVQLTVVLKHLAHLYPDWSIDVVAKVGAHTLYRGLCRQVLTVSDSEPDVYAAAHTLRWDEANDCYPDAPSTKAERCLREVFKIEPIPSLCGYTIDVSDEALARAESYLASLCQRRPDGRWPVVLFHYQGNSSASAKSLDGDLVAKLIEHASSAGYLPVILDWDGRQLPGVECPDANHPLWLGYGTGDGETIAALVERSAAMVGIDSGPGHIAGATSTPTLIVWTGHHPLHYYEPAWNVRHAVPAGHKSLLRGKPDLSFFAAHYDHRLYGDLNRDLPALFADFLSNPSDLIPDDVFWIRNKHREQDRTIIRDVYAEDCYGVDQLPWQPQYVVDVGAHIGTFARRILPRIAGGKVICVEPDPANLPALRRNVGHWAAIIPAACSYGPGTRLASTVYEGTDNTGGSRLGSEGEHVLVVSLEQVIADHGLPHVDVLKLDCEWSELSILANANLDRVRMIVGEWHDRDEFMRIVSERLSGWTLTILRDGSMGLFRLDNPAPQTQTPLATGGGCSGCQQRKETMNKWFPGSGNLAESAIDLADRATGGLVKRLAGVG